MARWMWHKSKPKQLLRKRVYERDDFTCQMCGWKPSAVPQNYDGKYNVNDSDRWLEIDHIHPVHLGGTNDELNLQTLCNKCNCKKGVRTD